MSKAMLKALKQEKLKQESKPFWYTRGRCYDRSQEEDRRQLSRALSVVPKPEWSYFDLKLYQNQDQEADRFSQQQQQLLGEQLGAPSSSRGGRLILLLEDTLVSSLVLPDGCILVSKRPGLDNFLREMAKHYELVLCTSSLQQVHAQQIVKQALDWQLFSGWFQLKNGTTTQAADLLVRLLRSDTARVLAVTSASSDMWADSDHVIVVPRYLPVDRHEEEGRLTFLAQVLLDLAKLPEGDERSWVWGLRQLKVQGVFRSIRNGEQKQNYNLNLSLGCSSSSSNNTALRVLLNKPITTVTAKDGPYLPPAKSDESGKPKPTIVLDLDETLVSSYRVSSTDEATFHRVAKRPGVDQFLASMAEKFELVLWTASWQAYADTMVDELLDPQGAGLFSHRLYVQHLVGDSKDLRKLGRRLERVIAVDDSEWRYPVSMRPNLILVPAYNMGGSEQDEQQQQHLQTVASLLLRLAASGADDLRAELEHIRSSSS